MRCLSAGGAYGLFVECAANSIIKIEPDGIQIPDDARASIAEMKRTLGKIEVVGIELVDDPVYRVGSVLFVFVLKNSDWLEADIVAARDQLIAIAEKSVSNYSDLDKNAKGKKRLPFEAVIKSSSERNLLKAITAMSISGFEMTVKGNDKVKIAIGNSDLERFATPALQNKENLSIEAEITGCHLYPGSEHQVLFLKKNMQIKASISVSKARELVSEEHHFCGRLKKFGNDWFIENEHPSPFRKGNCSLLDVTEGSGEALSEPVSDQEVITSDRKW